MALAGLGFVVARFHLLLRSAADTGGWHQARLLGVALVLVGLAVTALGLMQHHQVTEMLAEHGDALPGSRRTAVAAAVITLLVLLALCVYLAASVR